MKNLRLTAQCGFHRRPWTLGKQKKQLMDNPNLAPKVQKAVSMICNDPGAKPCTVETRYNLKSESQIQQHASQLNGQVATAMSRDAHGHMDIMGCTGVSRHVQGWTKLAGVEYNGMSGLTTVSLLGRTNTSCTCVSVHPSHCPL